MKKKSVILIGFMPNPRMYKRIEVEKDIFDLYLICWNRDDGTQINPNPVGYSIHCIDITAPNNPLKRMIPYKKFTSVTGELLEKINPSVIHVQGLDMLEIAYNYKKKSNNKVNLIYEVADLHHLIIDEQKNPITKIARYYLRKKERNICKQISLLIVTSEKYIDIHFKTFVPAEKILFMPNVPDLTVFENYARKKTDINDFTVGFVGGIRYPEQINNLITAVEQTKDKLLMAGFEQGGFGIQKRCKEYDRCEWMGRFDFKKQAAQIYGKCDLVYSVYDVDMKNVRVALPNKLYEAIYCEIPIIVAKGTYLSELVEEWGVGVSVNHKSVDELVEVITELKNNSEYYNNIVENCRKHKDYCDLDFYNDKLKERLKKLESKV